ncbi:MAG: SLBB domain-containing protein [Endomicrobiia bacterium]
MVNGSFNKFLYTEQQNLSEETLKSDLSYYKKLSIQKNLTDNDKYYILLRIYEKYKDTSIDISNLIKEIKKVKPDFQAKSSTKAKSDEEIKKNQEIKSETEKIKEDYKIEEGDVLNIFVQPANELSRETIVLQDGTIDFPLIGNIKAKGLTAKQLSKVIEDGLSLYVTRPSVSVSIKYFSRRQVFVMGEVVRPGAYEYRENFRLFDLITTAGGFTQLAGTKNIKVHRGEPHSRKTININLDEILRSGDLSKDFVLEPGDIVEVPRQPKKISVIGEVRNPGNYDWKEDMFVLDAVSIAGGPSDLAKLGSVKIFRETQESRKTFEVNLRKVMSGNTRFDKKLEPGDIVFVPKKTLASGQWFVNTLLPWLSLISLVLVIIAYTPK